MWRSDQRNVILSKDVLQKSSKASDFIRNRISRNAFQGNCAFFLDTHRRFVRCKKQSGAVETSMAVLENICAC